MSVDTAKQTLCINQMIGQKTDTAIIEEDFVVPDIKPDILSVINTQGTVCIYKKEILDGKLKIDGCINTYIIYLADDEQMAVRSLNTSLDFSQTIDFGALRVGMFVDSNICIKQIECRVLNGRKINVRAILDIDLKAYSNENVEFMNEIKNVNDIQLLTKNFVIDSLLGTGNTKVYAKDTVIIDNIDELSEIMKVNVEIKNSETKVSYNKILVKADAEVKIMYLTSDNRICTKSATIPIMGFIDMPDVSDENLCEVKYEIKNMLLKPNSIEEHSIYVEIEIEVNTLVYQKKSLDMIQDLYSPSMDLAYKQRIVKAMSKKVQFRDMCSIREKETIPEIGNGRIYDVDIRPYIVDKSILKDRIVFQGEVEAKFIFASDNNAKIDMRSITIPFEYGMNCPDIDQNFRVNTNIEAGMNDFVIMPDGGIDTKIDLNITVDAFRNEDINIIQEIEIEENRNIERYSVIIYFVKPGDTLWKIAKKYKSTVDAIKLLNNIEDERNLQIGQQLFIPR